MKLMSPSPGTMVAVLLLDIIIIVSYILTATFLQCTEPGCNAVLVQYFLIIVGVLITIYLVFSIVAFVQDVRSHKPYDPKSPE